jgi:hypothetical protein
MIIHAKVPVMDGLTAYAYKDIEIDDLELYRIFRHYNQLGHEYQRYLHKISPDTCLRDMPTFEEWYKDIRGKEQS